MFWKKKEQERIEGIAWFSYTVILPELDDDEKEVSIMGNFIFKNTGNTTLHNPIICLRIKPPHDVRLGGKIGALTHTALSIDGTNAVAWHYVQEHQKESAKINGEHWLKPNHLQQIEPNTTLAFSNEIQVSTVQENKFILIEGFTYCDEIPNGIPTLNNIIINF